MRAADLVGRPVRGPGGRSYGKVLDVRLVQDGPLMGAWAALRVQGLVVGHHAIAAHLGYDRAQVRGPWLVAAVVRLLTKGNRFLPWDDARLVDDAVVTDRAELDHVRAMTGPG